MARTPPDSRNNPKKKAPRVSLSRGRDVILDTVKTLGNSAGVYRMIADNDDVLYVGKARQLKKRVINYTHIDKLPVRLQRMVSETARMEIIRTGSEVEALLLESNLIKKLKPRYNILLRDDKSFPYIWITSAHDFPRLVKYRGSKKEKGEFFGPFASAGAVNRTLNVLQRVFMLRNCTDSMFETRTRPCLQYHIKRCTAPCVDYVSKQEYGAQVEEARQFLDGDSQKLQKRYQSKMQDASEAMQFEKAATYRDRLRALTSLQSKQTINVSEVKHADVHALYMMKGRSCIQTFFFRGGQNFGNRSYFPKHESDETAGDIMAAFLLQFYENKPVPPLILVNCEVSEKELLAEALKQRREANVDIVKPARGQRKKLVDFVEVNAKDAFAREQKSSEAQEKIFEEMKDIFDLTDVPERIEVYDNSHISGTNMVGAMIVAGPEGLRKSAYRKFNIKQADASDDFGMMREVMERRFRAFADNQEEAIEEAQDADNWPSLLLIDGGKGQLSSVMEVLDGLGLSEHIAVVAISKGPDRNAGREEFHQVNKPSFKMKMNDPVLHYLQRLRDEAHRFAITAHRTRRKNEMTKSALDSVPGIGAKRKKALLHHFGSARAVERASVADLSAVEGISRAMAEKIHHYFVGESS